MDELIAAQPTLLTLGEFSETSWTAPPAMTYDEWAEVGVTLQTIQGAVNWWVGDWLNEGEKRYGETYAQAIEATGRNYDDLVRCKFVSAHVESLTRVNNLSWSHHREIASLEPDDQAGFLAWAEESGASVQELRHEMRQRRRADIADSATLDGLYRVIYADPPWQYSDSGVITTSDNYGRAERHYPTMSIKELCDMGPDIFRVTADNAVLFIWVTSPVLPECFDVIGAWGFEYKASFIWDKIGHNYGHYNSVRHELLLVCTRGSCLPDSNELFDSVIAIEKPRQHSEKPEEFRALIESLYTRGNKIELFSRKSVPGWATWGNQATG